MLPWRIFINLPFNYLKFINMAKNSITKFK